MMNPTYATPGEIRKRFAKEKVLSWHQVQTWRGLLSIIIEWSCIVGMAAICERYFSWPLYLFTVVFIGARYLALGLIMHEAVHMLISRNRMLNDVVAEIFCAWPLLISMRSYRIKHLAHHRHLNTDKDPDYVAKTDKQWNFPMRPSALVKILLIQISGFGMFETFRVMSGRKVNPSKKVSLSYTLARFSFYITVAAGAIFFHWGEVLLWYWLIPFATWTQLANRLRRIAEHSGIDELDPSMRTRTTRHRVWVQWFLAPKNISLHNEHHLYPGVPCYHLPKVHQAIMENAQVSNSLWMSDSYHEVYQQCTKK